MKGGLEEDGAAENLKILSCHGERAHYDRFRPKTLRVECGRGRGAKVQLPGEAPFVLIGRIAHFSNLMRS